MAANKGKSRDAADDALALGLARGLTLSAAAEAAGISLRTASRRRSDAAFNARVRELRAEVVSRASGLLADGMAEASSVMRDLLKSENEPVKLRAADLLLTHAVRVREAAELEERLAELEERLAQVEQEGRT